MAEHCRTDGSSPSKALSVSSAIAKRTLADASSSSQAASTAMAKHTRTDANSLSLVASSAAEKRTQSDVSSSSQAASSAVEKCTHADASSSSQVEAARCHSISETAARMKKFKGIMEKRLKTKVPSAVLKLFDHLDPDHLAQQDVQNVQCCVTTARAMDAHGLPALETGSAVGICPEGVFGVSDLTPLPQSLHSIPHELLRCRLEQLEALRSEACLAIL